MKHEMNLRHEPFEKIVTGRKTIELRLYDEKRKKISVGDEITFRCEGREVRAEVTALHLFASFEELYRSLPLESCGYRTDELASASPDDMLAYYSAEEQQLFGVVGIGIRVV